MSEYEDIEFEAEGDFDDDNEVLTRDSKGRIVNSKGEVIMDAEEEEDED